MAKNWYDSAAPTMELGGLLGMPDMRLTDEDKKRAFWQALMQGGMGMAAASLGGANTAQSLGKGLLGGADAYGQGLQAPMARFHQAKEQLDFQGKQLGNAKNYAELQQQQNLQRLLGGVGNVTANPFQMEAQGNGAVGIGPLAPDSPEMQQGARRAQAELFNDPAFLTKLAANGMKGSDISALGGRFDPQKRDAGSYYQDPITKQNQYYTSLPQGMMIQGGQVVNARGYTDALQDRTLSEKAAETAAELQRRMGIDPLDVRRAGAIANAEEGARFPYKTESFYNPETRQTGTRFVYEGTGLPGQANGISPRVLQEYQSLPDGPQKRALAKAMQLEAEGGGKPYSVVARGQMPTGPNQAQAAQDKGFAERYVKMYDTLLSTSDNERTKHQAYQQINSLLGQYEGGTMADTMLSIASEANRLGLPIDAKLSNKEAANAIRNQLMGEFKQMLPGPMSDADRKFLMSIPPSILNSSRGRQIMEEIQNRKATRASAEADMAAQYLQKYGTIDINFERSLNKWRRENRMFEGMSYGR